MITLEFTDRTLHTAQFDCNLGQAGYITMALPVADWKEMGCPKEIIFSITPVAIPERQEKVVA